MEQFRNNIENILASATDLLNKTQEQQLFRRLVVARNAVKKLEKKRKRTTVESSQLGIARKQMKQLRDRLITSNMPLVVAMSQRFTIPYVTQYEMISEGLMKLIHCVDRFDVERGNKFSTYFCRALFRTFTRMKMLEAKHHFARVEDDESVIHAQSYEPIHGIDLTHEIITLRQIIDENEAHLSIIGLTKERIRQIEEKAIQKIRERLENKHDIDHR